MSIETEITRISTNVSDTLSAVSEMGGEVPEGATSNDMAAGVRSIPVGAKIDDTTPSSTTVYSSQKIESVVSALNEAIANKGDPTEEQVQTAVNAYLEANPGAIGTSVYIGPTQPTDGTRYWLDTSENSEPEAPKITLTGITATYTGGDVAVGTELTALTGVVVTATYSDGSSEAVTGYTLSGAIAEGSNTITVTYEDMTATFTVTGVAEEEPGVTTYTITNNLTNVTSNNSTTSVAENAAYTATLTAADGYTLNGGTVTVTMGGTDVTATAYADGVVSIDAVTGDVVITAAAAAESVGDIYTIPVDMYYHDSGLNHQSYDDDGSKSQSVACSGATAYSDVFSIDTKVRIKITLTNTIYGRFTAACLAANRDNENTLYAYYQEPIQTKDTYATGGKEYTKEYMVRAGYSLRLNIVNSSNLTALEILREDNGVTFTKKGW